MDYTGWLVNMAPGFTALFILLLIWSLIWKGVALWKAARNCDKVWFVLLLIVNTMGILEIFYIFVFSKREKTCCEDKEIKSEEKTEDKKPEKSKK